jgi:uncharacterized protein YcfL
MKLKKLLCLSITPLIFCFGCSTKAGKTVETNRSPIVAENKNPAVNINENVQTNTAANVPNDAKNSADEKDLLSFFSGALNGGKRD